MALTDPGTRSPGRVVIYYQAAGIEHSSSAWLVEGTNINAAIDDIRDEANTFAQRLMEASVNTSFAHTWAVIDPDGITLFTENFPAVIPGERTPSGGDVTSQSTQITFTGKGTPPTIGVAKGFTRTSLFPGIYSASFMLNKDYLDTGDDLGHSVLSLLRDSSLIGADKFGQKATYSSRILLQINAHWQREFGL